ncbi:unnamed protein product [Adineta steineri]|uniref:RING-type domain-containing protein n=1 Tax=Adineta steineri TaxID=433720 RepID=A0A814LT44_9BILA|nr:unnamed protein product [Adineta steineri]
MSQPINYNTYSTIGYNYHHHNGWEKPNYETFNYHQTPYSIGTMSSTTGDITNKSTNTYSSSFDLTSNLNNSNSSLYRRHTESTLPTSALFHSSSSSSSSTTNYPSPNPFNYSNTTTHYHPSELFFGWNHGPSLMRAHSASYRDYPQSKYIRILASFPSYNPIHSSTLQSTTSTKPSDNRSSIRTHTEPINTPMNSSHNYSSFLNIMPPLHFPLPPLPPSSSASISSKPKHPISSTRKRPRLTAQLRSEILKLKASRPAAFVWEIQQSLLQNDICTRQTLPHATAIQRILNESTNSLNIIKQEPKSNDNILTQKSSSSLTICLSPSQSDNESASECSICLETYRSGQEVSILSCSHEYHSSCIKEWMIKNRSCPMCRKDIHNQPQFVTLLI